MTMETYEKATALLEDISSIQHYINQFQSTIDSVPVEEDDEEMKESRKVLEEAIHNLQMELNEKELAFQKL